MCIHRIAILLSRNMPSLLCWWNCLCVISLAIVPVNLGRNCNSIPGDQIVTNFCPYNYTAQMWCHRQNFVAITLLAFRWNRAKFLSNLDFGAKNSLWNEPQVHNYAYQIQYCSFVRSDLQYAHYRYIWESQYCVWWWASIDDARGLILLTWFNFNPSMDRWSHAL